MTRNSKVGREVLSPSTEFLGSNPPTVVLGTANDAEDLGSEEGRNRFGHSCESLHEEIDGFLAEQFK
jgi:hypothetical protein